MLFRASVLIGLVLAGCPVDLGIDQQVFRCGADADCIEGYLCHPDRKVCQPPMEPSIPPDQPDCGFEEFFETFDENGPWTLNDAAYQFAGQAQLTPTKTNRRGTLWNRHPIMADRFTLEVDFSIWGGGNGGGEGMAVAWIDGADTALGNAGGNFAVYGLSGYLVEIDTVFDSGGLQTPHVAVARTQNRALPNATIYKEAPVTPLRTEKPRTLRIEFDMGRTHVFLDGQSVLTTTITDYEPFPALFGAGASTSHRLDSHTVHRFSVTCGL